MTESQSLETKVLSPEIVKGKMQLVLSKAEKSTQSLHDEESKLVYNEDNLPEISKFINQCKAAEKIVEDERKKLKEPYLQGSRVVDDGAKLVSTDLVNLKNKALVKYTKLCQEVEKKREEAETERLRVATIREAMNSFKIDYSGKIAMATTLEELVSIERLINLQTGAAGKYQEFLPEFKSLCEPIRSLLSQQKEKVRQLQELDLKRQEAEKTGNDEEILEIMEKTEILEGKIAETKENVQQEALNQAIQSDEAVTEMLPEIPKGGRNYWKWEMVDEKAATKAGLTLVIPNKEKIDELLKDKRDNETEVTENGIRYFIEKRY